MKITWKHAIQVWCLGDSKLSTLISGTKMLKAATVGLRQRLNQMRHLQEGMRSPVNTLRLQVAYAGVEESSLSVVQ